MDIVYYAFISIQSFGDKNVWYYNGKSMYTDLFIDE